MNRFARNTIPFTAGVGAVMTLFLVTMTLISPLALASQSYSQYDRAWTIDLSAPQLNRTISLSGEYLPSHLIHNVSLLESTPSVPGTGPANTSILTSGGQVLWSWPGTLGTSVLSSQAQGIVADNGTTHAYLSIPTATLLSGSAGLFSTQGDLSGDYTLKLSVGNSAIVSRSGSAGYSPFQNVNWASSAQSGLLSTFGMMTTQNGSWVMALGDQNGFLTVYGGYPGLQGSMLLNTGLAPPTPVGDIIVADMFHRGMASIAATDGFDLFLLSQMPGGSFQSTVFPVPSNSSALPQLRDVATGSLASGNPFVVATSDTPVVYVTNYTGTGVSNGWSSPLSKFATMPWVPASLTVFDNSTTGNNSLAIGGLSSVLVYEVSGSSSTLRVHIGLPNGTEANDLAFSTNGNALFIAGSDGNLYRAEAPQWNAQVVNLSIPLTGAPLLRLAHYSSSQGERLGVMDGQNNVYVLTGLSSSTLSAIKLAGPQQGTVSTNIRFGNLFGYREADLLTGAGNSLWAALSESNFNSTQVPGWLPSLKDEMSSTPLTNDGAGNLIHRIVVNLTVSGGAARLVSSPILYNGTEWSDVSSELAQSLNSVAGTSKSVNLTIRASGPGVFGLQIVIVYSIPTPQTSLDIFMTLVSREAIWIVIGTIAIGGAFFLSGSLRYWMARRVAERPNPPKGE